MACGNTRRRRRWPNIWSANSRERDSDISSMACPQSGGIRLWEPVRPSVCPIYAEHVRLSRAAWLGLRALRGDGSYRIVGYWLVSTISCK